MRTGSRSASGPGDHLVGHSYGGVIALLAAAEVGDRLASLTVIEPPCTSVALDDPAVAAFARGRRGALGATARATTPRRSCARSSQAVGSDFDPPSPLPPELERGVRALIAERGPWEAEIPLDALAALDLPTLVVSGRAPPRVRRDLRRARARARRRAPRDPGARPQPAARPGVHRRAARLRRPRGRPAYGLLAFAASRAAPRR